MKKLVFSMLAVVLLSGFLTVPLVSADAVKLPFDASSEGVSHLPNLTATDAEIAAAGQGATGGTVAFRKLMNTVGSFLELVLGPIAIFALFVAGYQLITAQSAASEEVKTQKMNVIYIIVGLVVFSLAGDIIYNYLFENQGSYLLLSQQTGTNSVAAQASKIVVKIMGVLNLFLSFSGALAILVLVVSSLQLVVNPGSDDEIEKHKKLIGYTAVGIIIIGLADTLVNKVIFPAGGYQGVNVSAFDVQLQGLSNYVLGFLGVGIFVTLVISGVMMVANQGNEETVTKIKSTLKNVVIGTIVVYSAYTIVATLLRTFLAAQGGTGL